MSPHDQRVEADIQRLRAEMAGAMAAGEHGRALNAYHDLRLAIAARHPQQVARIEQALGLRTDTAARFATEKPGCPPACGGTL